MTNDEAVKKSIKHWEDNVRTLKIWNKEGYTIYNDLGEFFVGGTDKVVHYGGEYCAVCGKY